MTVAREAKKERAERGANIKKIEPFFKPMGKPETYDWLASHNEPGQTFDEYLDAIQQSRQTSGKRFTFCRSVRLMRSR